MNSKSEKLKQKLNPEHHRTDKQLNKLEEDPDLFFELKKIALSDEFEIALQLALRSHDGRYGISEVHHLHYHNQTYRMAARDFIAILRDIMLNPKKSIKEDSSLSDFAGDDD